MEELERATIELQPARDGAATSERQSWNPAITMLSPGGTYMIGCTRSVGCPCCERFHERCYNGIVATVDAGSRFLPRSSSADGKAVGRWIFCFSADATRMGRRRRIWGRGKTYRTVMERSIERCGTGPIERLRRSTGAESRLYIHCFGCTRYMSEICMRSHIQ